MSEINTGGLFANFFAENPIAAKFSFAIAGAVGAAVRMQFVHGLSRKQAAGSFISAVLLADMFAQPLADGLGAGAYAFGAAGMIALLGLNLIGAAIKGITEFSFADAARMLVDAIAKRISGGKE